MVERLIRWFLFSVVVALLPIGFNLFRIVMRGGQASVEALTGHGELLLVAAAICATALGEIITDTSSRRIPKLVAVGASVIILVFASLSFADIAAGQASGDKIESTRVAWSSLTVLFFAVLAGGSCIALTEVR